MGSRYRILTLGIPRTQSMPSRDINAATPLSEASLRRDNTCNGVNSLYFIAYVIRPTAVCMYQELT